MAIIQSWASVNPKASMLAKKRQNYHMRWLFVVLNCEAVTLPLKQNINDKKALQSKS